VKVANVGVATGADLDVANDPPVAGARLKPNPANRSEGNPVLARPDLAEDCLQKAVADDDAAIDDIETPL